MNEYRERVIEYRKRHGITQREMAKKCELSPPTIIKIEGSDRYYPNVMTRGKLDRVLDEE